MGFIEIPAPDFDLDMTLESGQVFHWEKIDNGFCGTIGELAVHVEQCTTVLKVRAGAWQLDCFKQSSGGSENERRRLRRAGARKVDCLKQSTVRGDEDEGHALSRIASHYFALDHPLAEIYASFPDDPVMNAARNFCRGLRIIRQPKWECLVTFICSSMKQVAHIRQISRKLRERFGERRSPLPVRPVADKIDNYTVHTFPWPERMATCTEKELRECTLGYRAKNLLATARRVASGEADLEKWSALSDVDLRAKLCQLPGVGAKVANCVMLFAYERLRAFPIDVWIERVLRERYFPRARKLNAARLRRFTEEYFGEHGGYAQQYLFHHARMTGMRNGGRRAVGAKERDTTARVPPVDLSASPR
jgi:N-glycosylase/DNA lyase